MSEFNGIEVTEKTTAFGRRIVTYALKNLDYNDPITFLRAAFSIFEKKTKTILERNYMIKSNCCLEAIFQRIKVKNNDENITNTPDNHKDYTEYESLTFFIQTKTHSISITTKLESWYRENVSDVILRKIDGLQEMGSGWTLSEIVELVVNNNKYNCFTGDGFIPLPLSIKNKKAIINVKNHDNMCFKWAVLAALHPPEKNSHRVIKYYEFRNELNFGDISFPVSLNDIDVFERLNETLSINVYALEKEKNEKTKKVETIVVPIRLTSVCKKNHIHLLLLNDNVNDNAMNDEKNNTSSLASLIHNHTSKSHYCYIKDLSKLLTSQLTEKNRKKKFLCDRCLHYFYTKEKLEDHSLNCVQQNHCKITLPSPENRWLYFQNFKHQLEVPFVVYADIECFLSPISELDKDRTPSGCYQRHIANSVGYYFHSRNNQMSSYYKAYSNSDCITWFANELHMIAKKVWTILHEKAEMIFTEIDKINFENAMKCYICGEDFDENCIKVRDHSHLTGKYFCLCSLKVCIIVN